MESSGPFFDQDASTIDLRGLLREALPIAVLVALVGFVAGIPLVLAGGLGLAPVPFTLLSQFILAVGSGLILLYIVTRAIGLAGV